MAEIIVISITWVSSITVRALDHCAEDQRFETHFELRIRRSLTVHPAANGDLVEHCGDSGGGERNWPPNLTKSMALNECLL